MHMQFIRNIQFTKLIKAEGRLREFNFRRLGGVNEGIYTVDVVDDRGNRIMFRMQKDGDHWKIITHPLPEWIFNYEQVFHEMIEEES